MIRNTEVTVVVILGQLQQGVAFPCVCGFCASGAAPQVSGIMHVLLLLRDYGIWLLLTLKTHLCNLEIPGGKFSIYFNTDCVCEWSLTLENLSSRKKRDCIGKSI